jgi:hypothetical protein
MKIENLSFGFLQRSLVLIDRLENILLIRFSKNFGDPRWDEFFEEKDET